MSKNYQNNIADEPNINKSLSVGLYKCLLMLTYTFCHKFSTYKKKKVLKKIKIFEYKVFR
jgi:hypothetical protein